MALSLRKRRKVWYARGTVRVGTQTVTVPEFSTGQAARADAEAAAAAEEARIRADILDGAAGRSRTVTAADCIEDYLHRPGGIAPQDEAKLLRMADAVGDRTLDRLGEAWDEWLRRNPDHSRLTATRYRSLLLAAIRYGCAAKGVPAPTLPRIAGKTEERLVWLADRERERLLAAYSPHAGCVALVLAYQGLRTREALQLTWRDIDWQTETIRVPASRAKAKRPRALPMHPKVRAMLWGLWHSGGMAETGHVFLSSRGEPYADTKDVGGNPLTSAHQTACRKAKVRNFRVHDWRHDWATRMVMAGVDLVTLMELGGWASLAMVQRYAAARADHRREAIARLA